VRGGVLILTGCGAAANTSAANPSLATVPVPTVGSLDDRRRRRVNPQVEGEQRCHRLPLKRAATSGGLYTQIAAPTFASYTEPSLTNGTTCYYVVSRSDGGQN
jgi:hypothetical protein